LEGCGVDIAWTCKRNEVKESLKGFRWWVKRLQMDRVYIL
jgi:hypothetical protein